jgi:hypothetical protein
MKSKSRKKLTKKNALTKRRLRKLIESVNVWPMNRG